MLRTLEQPGCLRISANARPANLASKVGSWPFQVGQPSAILILPALVNRMPPKTSSMYPSSISRALCSDGIRCIKPLAPSCNETNSSRVNGGAAGGPFSEYAPRASGIKPKSSPQSNWSSPEGLAFRQISRPRLTLREVASYVPSGMGFGGGMLLRFMNEARGECEKS